MSRGFLSGGLCPGGFVWGGLSQNHEDSFFLLQLQNIVTYDKKSFCKGHVLIHRDKCLELNFTASQFPNKLFEQLFGIIRI